MDCPSIPFTDHLPRQASSRDPYLDRKGNGLLDTPAKLSLQGQQEVQRCMHFCPLQWLVGVRGLKTIPKFLCGHDPLPSTRPSHPSERFGDIWVRAFHLSLNVSEATPGSTVADFQVFCPRRLLDLPGRGSSFLAALTNLRRLRIFASEYERWTPYCTFFHPIPILPALRHLDLCFSLNKDVLDFVQSHYLRLSSLSIYTVDAFDGYDIPATGMAAELCARYSLPLPGPVSRITCSPFLAPIFVPGSCVSAVSLWWESWDDVDDAAETAVPALAQSAGPVRAVSFWSYAWNLKFIELSATHLQHLELLWIDNKDEELSSGEFESDPEAYFVSAARYYLA